MEIKRGVPASEGIAIGEVLVLGHEHYQVTQRHLTDLSEASREAQKQRFAEAAQAAADEIRAATLRMQEQDTRLGATAILDFQTMTLESPDLRRRIGEAIDRGATAEHAVQQYFMPMRNAFQANDALADRVGDIDALERRLLRHLLGQARQSLKDLERPVVLVASDLDPATTAELPLDKIIGIATDRGGATSHTAVVAASRNIPAVVGLGNISSSVHGGETVILDGRQGRVLIKPDRLTLERYTDKRKKFRDQMRRLSGLRDLPAETLDGYVVRLLANIEFPEEVEHAVREGAMGVGLYRTEFLYSEANPDPSEREHEEAYTHALRLLQQGGKRRPFVIRTLDLGADKFTPDKEAFEKNPFLGQRSIRWCFENSDVFMKQLRAILRVSTRGDVRIMLPMVSRLEDWRQAMGFIEEAKSDLKRRGEPFNEKIPVGIMVEVPSAALIADELAEHVDFFSIGTNDLVQYTLAVDRINERVSRYYQPSHPSIFRLLLRVVEAGRRTGTAVSLCGEISGQTLYTLFLLGLGLRDLSMAPARIKSVKGAVRSLRMRDATAIAQQAFGFPDGSEAEAFLKERARHLMPALFG